MFRRMVAAASVFLTLVATTPPVGAMPAGPADASPVTSGLPTWPDSKWGRDPFFGRDITAPTATILAQRVAAGESRLKATLIAFDLDLNAIDRTMSAAKSGKCESWTMPKGAEFRTAGAHSVSEWHVLETALPGWNCGEGIFFPAVCVNPSQVRRIPNPFEPIPPAIATQPSSVNINITDNRQWTLVIEEVARESVKEERITGKKKDFPWEVVGIVAGVLAFVAILVAAFGGGDSQPSGKHLDDGTVRR